MSKTTPGGFAGRIKTHQREGADKKGYGYGEVFEKKCPWVLNKSIVTDPCIVASLVDGLFERSLCRHTIVTNRQADCFQIMF